MDFYCSRDAYNGNTCRSTIYIFTRYVTIKDLDGNIINIQDIDNGGNPIILNFWATWCKPCKNELNNIHEVYEEWKEETNVKIIIVSVDDSRSNCKS